MCKRGCHGCPALHRTTGPLATHDNHSLAEGHHFCPNPASNHLLSCWSAHRSLAPRTRTLLGVLGQATLNFVAVATLLFFFFCVCPKFCDLAKQRRKFFLRVSEVGRIDFVLYFFWLCVFLLVFFSSAAIARRTPRRTQCPHNIFHTVPTPQTPFSTAPMPSKHISPDANTSNPLLNCPHALKTYFTQCQHLKAPF